MTRTRRRALMGLCSLLLAGGTVLLWCALRQVWDASGVAGAARELRNQDPLVRRIAIQTLEQALSAGGRSPRNRQELNAAAVDLAGALDAQDPVAVRVAERCLDQGEPDAAARLRACVEGKEDPTLRHAALRGLLRFPAEVNTVTRAAAGDSDPALRSAALKALCRLQGKDWQILERATRNGFADALSHPDRAVRRVAIELVDAYGWTLLGSRPGKAVPSLIQAVEWTEGEPTGPAAKLLLRSPQVWLPAVTEALRSPEAEVRAGAAGLLAHYRPIPRNVARELGSVARHDTDRRVRLAALAALAYARPWGEAVLPLIQGLVQDPDSDVRRAVARLLGEPKVDPEHVDLLVRLLADREPAVREAAAGALEHFTGDVPELGDDAGETIHTLLTDSSDKIRRQAARLLAWIPAKRRAAEDATALLADRAAAVRAEAARTLERLGPSAAVAIPTLLQTVREGTDLLVLPHATNALFAIVASRADAPTLLVDLMAHRSAELALRARQRLAGFGPNAVAPLQERLAATDPKMRAAAAETLVLLGPAAAPAVGALTERLADPVEGVRRAAIAAIAGIGPAAGSAADELLGLAVQAQSQPRVVEDKKSEAAALELKALGRLGAGALPAYRAALREGELPRRQLAAALLGDLEKSAEEAVEALIPALSDPEATVVAAAVRSLARLGPAARSALPALRDLRSRSSGMIATQLDALIARLERVR